MADVAVVVIVAVIAITMLVLVADVTVAIVTILVVTIAVAAIVITSVSLLVKYRYTSASDAKAPTGVQCYSEGAPSQHPIEGMTERAAPPGQWMHVPWFKTTLFSFQS